MKQLLILMVIAMVSCTGAEKKPEVVERIVTEIVRDTVTVEKIVVEKESDFLQNEKVKKSFMNFVDALNNANTDNLESLFDFLDEEYVFKGREKEANDKRLRKQLEKFQYQITDVEIKDIKSSCDLAYLIVSFKKTLIGRESGNAVVDLKDKVGLFVLRKNTAGEWKLLVQKTDNGFAHWFYMPEEK